MMTQGCLGVFARIVGVLAGAGVLQVWMIWLGAVALGVVKCFDLPALQGFVKHLVGTARLPNAVAWMNATNAIGRMLGAACGGRLLTVLGATSGFLVNTVSFALVLVVLAGLRPGELSPRMPVAREPGQLGAGLRYVCSDRVLMTVAIVMLVVFPGRLDFQIAIALIASDTLVAGGATYGALMAALGLGALACAAHAFRADRPAGHHRLDLRSRRGAGCSGRGALARMAARSDLRLWCQRQPIQRDSDQHIANADAGRHASPRHGAVRSTLQRQRAVGRTGIPMPRCRSRSGASGVVCVLFALTAAVVHWCRVKLTPSGAHRCSADCPP